MPILYERQKNFPSVALALRVIDADQDDLFSEAYDLLIRIVDELGIERPKGQEYDALLDFALDCTIKKLIDASEFADGFDLEEVILSVSRPIS